MSGHSATRSGEYEIFEGKIVPRYSAQPSTEAVWESKKFGFRP
jgi:hypothetical protein